MGDEKSIIKYNFLDSINKENNGVLTFLYLLLNFLLVIGVLGLIGIPGLLIWNTLDVTTKVIAFAEINCIIAVLIIYELKNIVDRIMDNKVFIIHNVKSFNRVGVYTLLLGIANMINDKINGSLKIIFVFDKYGNLKFDIFAFIMLSCTFATIAELLKRAIKIKNENDLTI
ncbi:DUF2975 domain-containing protein [Clostridium coskatii]|uniref:DUF2975 domain-containing protein n=1 Tax=Clostridium coskatii TaxID=1705578 RepID=A0A166TNI9_9CLOT|nr:DUF2975 domain-containing protein [Clostridium coskatii]OAA93904.1 hypothetical protein WX73_03814 [Clostridium coskatii]OBR95233.1 hypothetical protein CLCOS_15570 [Clostridium coskatii]